MKQGLPMRWAYYLAASHIWSAILTHEETLQSQRIMEIGSGWAPKIPLALSLTAFQGAYTALDSSQQALDKLLEFTAELETTFEITTICTTLFEGTTTSYDIVILNHVLDDILLVDFLQNYEDLDHLLAHRTVYEKAWRSINANKLVIFQRLLPILTESLLQRMSQGGKLFLSQYPSYPDKLSGYTLPTTVCMEFFEAIQEQLRNVSKLTEITPRYMDLWESERTMPFTRKSIVVFSKTNLS